jgi:hypothetical protein
MVIRKETDNQLIRSLPALYRIRDELILPEYSVPLGTLLEQVHMRMSPCRVLYAWWLVPQANSGRPARRQADAKAIELS